MKLKQTTFGEWVGNAGDRRANFHGSLDTRTGADLKPVSINLETDERGRVVALAVYTATGNDQYFVVEREEEQGSDMEAEDTVLSIRYGFLSLEHERLKAEHEKLREHVRLLEEDIKSYQADL